MEMRTQFRQRGFTLIEIMVVIFILGLLAAVVAPNILQSQDQAMVQKARSDVSALEQALEMYKLDNFVFPSNDQGLSALVKKPTVEPLPKRYRKGGYIKRLPQDPWGNPYQYRYPGERGVVDIYSLGADASPGGEDIAKDIGNWNEDS